LSTVIHALVSLYLNQVNVIFQTYYLFAFSYTTGQIPAYSSNVLPNLIFPLSILILPAKLSIFSPTSKYLIHYIRNLSHLSSRRTQSYMVNFFQCVVSIFEFD